MPDRLPDQTADGTSRRLTDRAADPSTHLTTHPRGAAPEARPAAYGRGRRMLKAVGYGLLFAAPVTFLTVNAVVADTHDEAMALMLPNLHMMAKLRTGEPLTALDIVEDAEAKKLSPQARAVVQHGLQRAVVGSPAEAAEQVRALAAEFDVDEVMVNPVASARRGTDPATAPARDTTLELLAKELF